MAKYEIVYDYEDERNIRDEFTGDWFELQDCIQRMRENGCYNIDAVCIDDSDDEDDWNDEDAWSSATDGDYSPAAPWNAPGMSAGDFVRGCY
ncbi:MAG: hypothetical protein J6W10_08520 [Kiritimatiellae bacterium]|nr:hypothetical protein [Kiritimatiellia bacterium]